MTDKLYTAAPPDKIWASVSKGKVGVILSGHHDKLISGWHEYTHSDLIPAMLAEARHEALREAGQRLQIYGDTGGMEVVLHLIDAEAAATDLDAVQLAAKVLLKSDMKPVRECISQSFCWHDKSAVLATFRAALRALAGGDSHD